MMTRTLQKLEKDIPLSYVGNKIKNYLKEEMELSSRFVRKAAIEKRIKINGRVIMLDYILREGDKISILLLSDETQNIVPEEIPLDIVFEDDAMLIVNKAPYMVVHPTKTHEGKTLSNAVMFHYQKNGEGTIVRLVSRLDMNTSGLIILAKNQFVHSTFSKEMQGDNVNKYYIAIVKGDFPEEINLINLPIYKAEAGAFCRVVDDRGQESLTKVKVIERKNGYSLLLLKLLTGRTHQIRVHLSHLGYPIIGDELYGGEMEAISRQALHAMYLNFNHPVTGKEMEVYAKPPEDIIKAGRKLGFEMDNLNIELIKENQKG